MKTQINKIFVLITLFSTIALPLLAQDGFGDPGGDVPVDGGLTLLIAAGVGYGAKKIRDNKMRKSN